MSGSISDLLNDTFDSAQRVWDSVAGANSNLRDLPSHVSESVHSLVDKLTNHGTLGGVPNPRDWLPEQLSPSPPPPPPPPRSPSWFNTVADHAARHPVVYSLTAVGLTTSTALYLFPRQTRTALSPLTSLVPLALLPDPKHRPLRLLPATHGVAAEVRKEAVVILGADCPAGRELALDLEKKGFVVVGTVREPGEVDRLEKSSRGWIKALVLDANESSSVAPFLRSLSTALSLRYPLHTSGDPFSRPAHALALTGVINCLSLSAAPEALAPLEAVESETVRRLVGERVATVVAVVKGVLPVLRTAAARPGAPTGVFISLTPSPSSNLSLPFLSLTSAADAALTSLFHSLRRELSLSTSSNLRLTLLETGLFDLPTPSAPAAAPLPIRLDAIYAPVLARRVQPVEAAQMEGRRLRCKGRKGTDVKRLSRKVWKILVRPSHAGAVERDGAGSWTYLFVSLLPHSLIDLCLATHDRLYSLYLSALSSRLAALSRRLPSRARSARPLPTPPPQAQHPSPLRPGASHSAPPHVPVRDAFVPSPAPSSAAGAANDDAETSSQSSVEDFGPLGASNASMGGSFVSVGREDAA
ncbi:hypothetical protein JCM10207_000972 [Rhodosporidiobolus poonsookiae]